MCRTFLCALRASVQASLILFNFQGPVRCSLIADSLFIISCSTLFVKHFFQTFLKFVSGDSVFEVLRAALSKQLDYYTNTSSKCQHLFSSFFDFFRFSFYTLSSYLFIYKRNSRPAGRPQLLYTNRRSRLGVSFSYYIYRGSGSLSPFAQRQLCFSGHFFQIRA